MLIVKPCVGKKTPDGDCKTRDNRNTSGVDNCSLGYRKYLLKIIAASNQGQKYGQLFRPKSVVYDDIDKKYYIVDCYHHSIQCFEISKEKLLLVQVKNSNLFQQTENIMISMCFIMMRILIK